MSNQMQLNTSSTKDKILDISQDLIQKNGYNAVSFQDIAELVGIKKPSITHHFASKEALGIAVVQRYRSSFNEALEHILANESSSAMQALEFYFIPYTDLGAANDKICLCASLAGEFMALPTEVQTEVASFFKDHISWIEKILLKGKSSKEFNFEEDPEVLALLFLGALEGALIVQRATQKYNQLEKVIKSLKARL